ncbi:MAG: class II aldolase/adducin family protein [Candidatus Omnitrophica bacterium]|nr:class II aldolase/adducin family protein [Candidatus Omnitrophota bacterium]
MNNDIILSLKRNIEAIGRLLWEKDLVTGLNGNISTRLSDENILITATKTCLGLLQENDIVELDLEGNVVGDGQASSERLLHVAIYKAFPEMSAVVHTHTAYTNAYFLENDSLTPRIFESKLYLGDVSAVPQLTPAVSDVGPVLEALKSNSIVVLKNHGVVAMGKDLFDCFLLVQCLEEAVKIDAISRLYHRFTDVNDLKPSLKIGKPEVASKKVEPKVKKLPDSFSQEELDSTAKISESPVVPKKFKLFSGEQIGEIVRLVNADVQMQDLGKKTKMTMSLAVKLNETGEVFCFHFEDGQIIEIDKDKEPEFLISAPENIWRAVFNRQIDPFVATTQKKMHLQGDFAKISKWYAPCSRIFELWAQVPIE